MSIGNIEKLQHILWDSRRPHDVQGHVQGHVHGHVHEQERPEKA